MRNPRRGTALLLAVLGLAGCGIQETDVIGMTLPIVKHSMEVESADGMARAIHEAFLVARTGRPGVTRCAATG